MEEPIKYAEAVLVCLGPQQLNSDGKRSTVDATTLEEVNGIFRIPDGKLRAFYDTSLRNYLERQGSQYVRKADARVRITDNFLRFFNRATALSEALYKEGSREPRLAYTMRALPAEGLQSLTLSLDGQVLRSTGTSEASKQFIWPGTNVRAASLSGSLGGPELGFVSYDGLWAVFRFFGDADRFQASSSGYTLQWVPRQGQSAQPMRLSSGKALALPFYLDLGGARLSFRRAIFPASSACRKWRGESRVGPPMGTR